MKMLHCKPILVQVLFIYHRSYRIGYTDGERSPSLLCDLRVSHLWVTGLRAAPPSVIRIIGRLHKVLYIQYLVWDFIFFLDPILKCNLIIWPKTRVCKVMGSLIFSFNSPFGACGVKAGLDDWWRKVIVFKISPLWGRYRNRKRLIFVSAAPLVICFTKMWKMHNALHPWSFHVSY